MTVATPPSSETGHPTFLYCPLCRVAIVAPNFDGEFYA